MAVLLAQVKAIGVQDNERTRAGFENLLKSKAFKNKPDENGCKSMKKKNKKKMYKDEQVPISKSAIQAHLKMKMSP